MEIPKVKSYFGLLVLNLAVTIRVKSCNILLSWQIFWENLGLVPLGWASELSNVCIPQLLVDLQPVATTPWSNSRDTLCSSAQCFLLFYEKLLVNKISYILLKDWQMTVKCKRAGPFVFYQNESDFYCTRFVFFSSLIQIIIVPVIHCRGLCGAPWLHGSLILVNSASKSMKWQCDREQGNQANAFLTYVSVVLLCAAWVIRAGLPK